MHKQGLKADSIGRSVLRAILSVRKAIHLVPAIQERGMSQQAEEPVRHGQLRNLMSMTLLMWGSITNAGTELRNVTDIADTSV